MMCDTSGRWYVLLVVKGRVPVRDGRLRGGLPDGGRTMDTFYSRTGSQASSGTDSTTCWHFLLEPTRSHRSTTATWTRWNVTNATQAQIRAQALRTKVRDTSRDLRRRAASYATTSARSRDALTGASVSSVRGRAIGSKVVHNLMTFAHGEFRVACRSTPLARACSSRSSARPTTPRRARAAGI
jgi:hypothetical protein